MMEQRATHPFDIDLLDYAFGTLDAALTTELDQHLSHCLLCRIHLNRIRRGGLDLGPDLVPELTYPEIAPTVLALVNQQHPSPTCHPGQLWLAGTPQRMLVWVEAVNETAGMVTVLAATLDVAAADHTSLIIDVPRLDREVAIFTSIPGWVPLDRLDAFVDDVDVVDEVSQLQKNTEQPVELASTDSEANVAAAAHPRQAMKPAAQLRTGTRISGSSDERLEFRQILADQLAALYQEDDPGDHRDSDEPTNDSQFDSIVGHMRDELAHDLPSKRQGMCQVNHAGSDFLVGSYVSSRLVRPVATLHELDCIMLVVASEPGVGLGFDPGEAYKLLLRSGASSLAVAETADPYLTRIFERSVLRPAYELPRATELHGARPLSESRPLIEAVVDYLQGDVFPIESEAVPLPRSQTDLAEFVPAQARAAIDELKEIRAQKGKNRALKALGPEDAAALHDAIATSPHLDALLLRIEEITVQ
jgi:hypothetical protein